MHKKLSWFIVFLLFFVYFFLIFDPGFHGSDEPVWYAYTSSIVDDYDLNIVNNLSPPFEQIYVSKTYNCPELHNSGSVLIWAPFYLYAKALHAIYSKLDFLAVSFYSFEEISKCVLSFSIVIICFIIFFLTYKLCRIFVSSNISIFSIIILFFGTPFFNFVLIEGGNSNILACLFLILSLWFCLNLPKFKKYHWFFYGVFFSISVAIKAELWLQLIFIFPCFMEIFLRKKAKWTNLLYFLSGFILIFVPRLINGYLKYGTFYPEENFTAIFLNYFSNMYNFKWLFKVGRGIFYTSPMLVFCLFGFLVFSSQIIKNVITKHKKLTNIDVLLLGVGIYVAFKLLITGRDPSFGGAPMRFLSAEFPILVLFYAYLLQSQKRNIRMLIFSVSFLIIVWNFLVVAEYLTFLDWVYVFNKPSLLDRLPALKYIFNLLSPIKSFYLKIWACLPFIILTFLLRGFIIKTCNLYFKTRKQKILNGFLFWLSFFSIYLGLAYLSVTTLNILNNQSNVTKLSKKGFFREAKFIEISPFKVTETVEEEFICNIFSQMRFFALKGDKNGYQNIKNFKSGMYGARESHIKQYYSGLESPLVNSIRWRGDGSFDQKVIDCYKEAIRIDPYDFEAYIGLADFYEFQKEYKKAVEVLKEVLINNPDFINAHLRLGRLYRKLGLVDNAILHYEKLLDVTSGSYSAFLALEDLYSRKELYDRSIENLNRALVYDSRNADVHFYLAENYTQKGQYSKAVEHFKKAIEYNPTNVYANFYLGEAYCYIGDKSNALQQLRILKRLEREDLASDLEEMIKQDED